MNIALATIYGDVYSQDRIFDPASCKIGQNLLVPVIELKKRLEIQGHQFHTADMYKKNEIDFFIFQDLANCYIKTLDKITDYAKYFLKRKWKNDYLNYAIKSVSLEKRLLIMQEPPVVCSASYDKTLHSYFGKILTWNDSIVDEKKYVKFYYPQIKPQQRYYNQFNKKSLVSMICGNKLCNEKNELYSERRKVIDYFEVNHSSSFDLYGVGWNNEGLKNYKGMVDDKLEVLSHYKYSVCYENMKDIDGYVSEKIFDCFFANCVPIYWGANNITDFVPENTFIDRRKFGSIDELYEYINNIDEKTYQQYLENIQSYLETEKYNELFSVDSYVNRIIELIK